MQHADVARHLAGFGLRVFRATLKARPNGKVDKAPLLRGWQGEATSDIERVERLWSSAMGEPEDHAVGVATDGLLVVDIDAGGMDPDITALLLAERFNFDVDKVWTVRTPSGGLHLYFKAPDQVEIASRGNHFPEMGSHVDIRASGGLVIAPGSVGPAGRYETIANEGNLLPAPQGLVAAVGERKKRANRDTESAWALDAEADVERARQWLLHDAPEAVEGGGGDSVTYEVAAGVLDFGLTVDRALDLLMEEDGWNATKASPAWSADDLRTKIENAARYRREPIGLKSHAALVDAFAEAVGPQELNGAVHPPAATTRSLFGQPFNAFNADELPPRRWLYGTSYIRRYVSGIIAPGGAGKSALLIAEALAMVSGKPLLGEPVHEGPMRVGLWNGEDPIDEIQRRVLAAAIAHGLGPQEIGGRLYVSSGRDAQVRLAAPVAGGSWRINEKAVEEIVAQCKELQLDVIALDPFVSTHGVDENDNGAIDAVVKALGRIAERADVAVMIVHHTRKLNGGEIDAESARGGSAIIGALRSARTLRPMTPDEAKKAGVDEDEAWRIVRLADAKRNLAPPRAAQWARMASVALGNGDNVQAMEAWAWPSEVALALSEEDRDAGEADVIQAIQNGFTRADKRSAEWVGNDIPWASEEGGPTRLAALLAGLKASGRVAIYIARVGGKERPAYRVVGYDGRD